MTRFIKWRPGNFAKHLLINLGLMAVAGCVVIWLLLTWLDTWTAHGHYELVPEVKGLSYDEACRQLHEAGFSPELTDSIYDTKSRPGTVIDQNPKTGTKVKEGRVVYLTITAFSPKTVTIPTLTDVSVRQARSVLEGLGISRINVVEVPSEFRGLVIAVKRDGQPVTAGARIPVTAVLTLEVGTGYVEGTDSIAGEEVNSSDSFFD